MFFADAPKECFAPPPSTLLGGLIAKLTSCVQKIWCAALSSVVCLGGPEGQVAGFNANVVFKNIAEPDVYILETYLRNEYLQQNLKNMKLQKKVFKMYFERF